ncbi:hypothetical protein [Polaribacter sp. Z022]|uniref:hypothetical protein n=1 Tax=Polaribacter sp. Z022 TaxID=2927125 RepID=UPI0020206A8F|nr:hypothetical protein [Polaribacter sp. Z022]MCL7752476.1 hypothetical protein [Polaribacter sp. Z022]
MKKKYFILFLIAIALFLFFRLPYRNYIYSNNFFDFYIADTSPNFFTVFLFVFLKKSQKKNHKNLQLCFFTFFGLILYEFFIQTKIYRGATIDNLDVIASLIAAVLCYFVCEKIDRKLLDTANKLQ